MSTNPPKIINNSNLSLAWCEAWLYCYDRDQSCFGPLIISIGDIHSETPEENQSLRALLDDTLAAAGGVQSRISAMTIFPWEMWQRRGKPDCNEFSSLCIERVLPRLQKLSILNRYGTYFSRMMAYTGHCKEGEKQINQLSHVIELLKKPRRVRESALQIACFDPAKDHTNQPVRGFPCLQQIGVTYGDDDTIALNAYYPAQYLFDRAYGNYLGLCHLGSFIAHQAGMRFDRLNCFIGKPIFKGPDATIQKLDKLMTLARSLTSGGFKCQSKSLSRSPFPTTRRAH